MNFKPLLNLFSILVMFFSLSFVIPMAISLIFDDSALNIFIITFAIIFSLGLFGWLVSRDAGDDLSQKDGFIIITFFWVVLSIAGSIPFILIGMPLVDAFFESMSGYTTTGATILHDIEAVPKGVLFWRSTTHWIGGMGIIVLAIAILPFLGIGGMQLFTAEAPGPGNDKLHPRITDTAKRLWLIYLSFTLIETFCLYFAGMSFFDAINHAMSTLSTGGFSTKNSSVAFYNHLPSVQYIIIFFMFLAGTNFVLSYFAFKGRIQKIIKDEEFKLYYSFVIIFTIIAALIIYFRTDITVSTINHPLVWGKGEGAIRHALFQVLTVITTTGFITADYTTWTSFLMVFFFGLMFLGGSAGSTSGGVKVVRHLLMIKNGFLEFKRTLHPSAIVPVRYNTKAVSGDIVFNILAFFILYMLSFIIGALVFSMFQIDFQSSIGLSASSLGNIGPALGHFGPVNNYAFLPPLAKWWSSFLMLIGRLELFTVLILFTPFFWRNR